MGNVKHLRSDTPEYRAWTAMRGRGIPVHSDWSRSFSAFLAYIGGRPSNDHFLNRIDGTRGYEPGNVRWTTWGEKRKSIKENALLAVKCHDCGNLLPISAFSKNRTTANGLQYECKKCRNARQYKWAKKNAWRLADIQRNSKYRKAQRQGWPRRPPHKPDNPVKHRARVLLRAAVSRGEITKPSICCDCLQVKKLTAHHKDYGQPFTVEWLCYLCHGLRHRREATKATAPWIAMEKTNVENRAPSKT